jgi:hypothetical protein
VECTAVTAEVGRDGVPRLVVIVVAFRDKAID